MNIVKKLTGILFRTVVRILLIFPVLPVLCLIEPFYRIRLGTMYTQRFGHLAINAETFLRKMQLNGKPKRTFYLFFGWDPANRQLMEMWKRLRGYPVRFVESRLGARIMFAWRPILSKTRFWEAHRVTGMEYYLFNHTDPVLSLTEEEENKGRRLLAEMGIGEDDWFVCFHARDANYLRKWRPELEEHWRKVDFRNVDIMKFLKTAEYITSLGGIAVRFGAFVEKPLPKTGNPKIIDYATKFRSDFMDIYLAQKCRFFIGTCSGPITIPPIFNVPVLSVGHFPYNFSTLRRCDIVIQRLISDTQGTRRVGYWEAQEAGYYSDWEEVSSMDPNMDLFDMLEQDEDDILDGCKDMIESQEGKEPSQEARELQKIYAEQYFSHSPDYEYAAKIGARFAVKYRDLIVPPTSGDRTGRE